MSPSPNEQARIGITLVTGFLGAGKSTLIRRILTENHRLRIVVIENEFAENSSVEQAIVTQGIGSAALEDFIELPNGCICCAAQNDLTDALTRLVDSKKGAFDHILVEASGLADPGPVAASFWVDEGVDSSLFLDAVVTIVDAVNVEKWLTCTDDTSTSDIAHKQIAMADIVLLNKMDILFNTGEVPGTSHRLSGGVKIVTDLLREHGCSAKIIPTTKCDVELSELLNIHAYDEETAAETVRQNRLQLTAHHVHEHAMSVGTVTVTFEKGAFDDSLLDRVFGTMLWETETEGAQHEGPAEIWRLKALVVIKDEPFKRIYQSVHTLFDNGESRVSSEDDPKSVFVFIGRRLDAGKLRSQISGALLPFGR